MIKEFDGKKYIELQKISIASSIIILMLLLLLSYFLYTFHNNLELIKSDPLVYGLKSHDFNSCSCQDTKGQYYGVNTTDVFFSSSMSSDLLGRLK